MPYKSDAQRRKMHAMADSGEISEKVVAKFDRESKGKKLPNKLKPGSNNAAAKSEKRGWSSYD